MKTEAELLPCPFCGHRAILKEYGGIDYDLDFCDEIYKFFIECHGLNCCAVMPHYKEKKDVIKAWNTRKKSK